jgi:hypothetical protein
MVITYIHRQLLVAFVHPNLPVDSIAAERQVVALDAADEGRADQGAGHDAFRQLRVGIGRQQVGTGDIEPGRHAEFLDAWSIAGPGLSICA